MDQGRRTLRLAVWTLAGLVALLCGPGAAVAQNRVEHSNTHNRYFGTEDYGVRAESYWLAAKENLIALRTCGAEVAHRDTVRLFGRNLNGFEGDIAVLAQQVLAAQATGRVLATASIANGRFTYTPIDRRLRQGVEASPSRSYTRELFSWGQTFWIGILPVRLDVTTTGTVEVYARRMRVTANGWAPTIQGTIGASASITGTAFAGLGLDVVVFDGRAGVEARLTLAEVALESPLVVGWNGLDMPVNLRFSNRIRILLTAEASWFDPFDWEHFRDEESGSIELVDYTFAQHTWRLARYRAW